MFPFHVYEVDSTTKCEYTLRPLTEVFGAEVLGINVDLIDKQCAEKLKQESYMYRFLLFRNQELSWQNQIRFTGLLGTPFSETKSINRKPHHKIPSEYLGIFSNDPEQGLTGVGIEGWHMDGSITAIPHAFTLIYCVSSSKNGPTLIVPLREIIDLLTEEERSYLETIHFVSGYNSSVTNPLIYQHPVTNEDTLLLALGPLSGQYMQTLSESKTPRILSKDETKFIVDLLESRILGSNLIYSHHYKPKDLIVLQNPSIAHIAGPGSQVSASISGLRLMRRSTVRGTMKPNKTSRIQYRCTDSSPEDEAYCFFSLKDSVYYPRIGKFETQSVARQRCRNINKNADLATITSLEQNSIAAGIISSTNAPHWLNGTNPNGREVFWNDKKGEFTNWDPDSGQPNDYDGPELCVAIGPFGRWFDLTCGPKTAPGSDPGPVMTWEDGTRQVFNVYPLCGVEKKYLKQ